MCITFNEKSNVETVKTNDSYMNWNRITSKFTILTQVTSEQFTFTVFTQPPNNPILFSLHERIIFFFFRPLSRYLHAVSIYSPRETFPIRTVHPSQSCLMVNFFFSDNSWVSHGVFAAFRVSRFFFLPALLWYFSHRFYDIKFQETCEYPIWQW